MQHQQAVLVDLPGRCRSWRTAPGGCGGDAVDHPAAVGERVVRRQLRARHGARLLVEGDLHAALVLLDASCAVNRRSPMGSGSFANARWWTISRRSAGSSCVEHAHPERLRQHADGLAVDQLLHGRGGQPVLPARPPARPRRPAPRPPPRCRPCRAPPAACGTPRGRARRSPRPSRRRGRGRAAWAPSRSPRPAGPPPSASGWTRRPAAPRRSSRRAALLQRVASVRAHDLDGPVEQVRGHRLELRPA